MKNKPPIEENFALAFTAHQWYQALSMHADTFAKRLSAAGITPEAHGLIAARDVMKAMGNDKDQAIARKNNADAEAREMENAQARKELLNMVECDKIIWSELLAPLRQELEQMPKQLGIQCNPQDPPMAEAVLLAWWERTKLLLIKERMASFKQNQ